MKSGNTPIRNTIRVSKETFMQVKKAAMRLRARREVRVRILPGMMVFQAKNRKTGP